ncbi:sensor histidine kinase [Natronosalvus caseinilyticus]|uniref:sensor histidine kinase n=1 Tax=Natronosalvus caseinilyticus TaxID=2953747 RepID=UPI0028AB43D0|nr:ATP-binding protein [Natronosalvus caseinilyticus]
MGVEGEGAEQYLIIGGTDSVDTDIIATILASEDAVSVDRANSKSAAAKFLNTKSYSGIISAIPNTDPLYFLNWISTRTGSSPLILLCTTAHTEALNWAAVSEDTHTLWYEANTVQQLTNHIQQIVAGSALNEQLQQHRRLQETIHELTSRLLTLTKRDEIETTVCNQLASTDLYQIAWCSRYIQDSDKLRPRAAVGINPRHTPEFTTSDFALDTVAIEENSSTGTDGSTVSIPLRHETTLFGVLFLTTCRTIDEVERELLADIGATVGAAIHTIETSIHSDGSQPPLETFTRVFSHELRNHLQGARAALENEHDIAEQRDQLLATIDRIEHLNREASIIAQNSLDEADQTVVQLSTLVDAAASGLAEFSPQITVIASTPILCSRPLAVLLFENLFRNAADHAGSDVAVRVGTCQEGFFVEDTGCGISPEKHDAIFEWGHTMNGGTGIGLALVKRIVELHDWDLTVTESEEGGFRIEIINVDTREKDTLSPQKISSYTDSFSRD